MQNCTRNFTQGALVLTLSLFLSACAAMPTSGPHAGTVRSVSYNDDQLQGIVVKKVDAGLTKTLQEQKKLPLFSEVFNTNKKPEYRAKPGDFLEIVIWETPPSLLFGSPGIDPKTGAISSSKAESLPAQMVMEDGKITVPFVGHVYVSGLNTRQIGHRIAKKLAGQANNPQVMVQFAANNASNVIVVGDFRNNTSMPITPKGERVLDAVAAAGGAAEDIKNTAVQLSRGTKTAILPLETVIKNPQENVTLLSGDVVTAQYQPQKITIMGAVMENKELPFEVQGISLAQALVRAGGFNDNRANPSGVFIFRFEKPKPIGESVTQTIAVDGTVPTVYEIDFSNPATFFITQNFMMQDGDVLYVANAQSVELGKFLTLVGSVIDPAADSMNFIRTMDLLGQ